MKRLTPLLLLLMMYCSAPTVQQGEVVFVGEPEWYIFQLEEWYGYKEYYIRTFGEVQVTATIQNIGAGKATNIYLLVDVCVKEDVLCSGKVWITPQLEAGATHRFEVKYQFEYYQPVTAMDVNLSLKWKQI